MTKPARSSLVIEGNKVKLRLQAERSQSGSAVHIDWLRFTADTRWLDAGNEDKLFPPVGYFDGNYWEVKEKERNYTLQQLRKEEMFSSAMQALELAESVVKVLGPNFQVETQIDKGHDFYAHRWSITHEGKEAGWVGFGASGDSPRQRRQAETIHVNLYGMACTFAQNGWQREIRALIERVQARITRIDLALDFFDGYPAGGIEAVKHDYEAGRCDVGGRRPKCAFAGDWCNGHSRSFYVGSKEAGKQTNVYEKGHQLFGAESGEKWLRFELRYGNKLRHIPTEILTNPDSYFAGASDWHSSVLLQQKAVTPTHIRCNGRLPEETVDAAVKRKISWFERVAAPTFSLLLEYLGVNDLLKIIEHKKRPSSLFGFSEDHIAGAFRRIFSAGEPCPLPA